MSLSLRPLEAGDAQAAADLLGSYLVFYGVTDPVSPGDMLDWWKRVEAKVGVEDEAGRLIAAGSVRRRDPFVINASHVDPAQRGRGAGTLLLDWGERWTAETGLTKVHASAAARDTAGKELFERRGYHYVRSFYRMAIDLEDPPVAPAWPAGFTVALEPTEERALYETLEEAFEDHWGHRRRTFEEWARQNGPFDERLCYLVRTEDGTPAAAAICDEERIGTAWVSILGVRAAWRRRGLGEALLRQAFRDLYALGRKRIVLGVDAENTTGATRLYERVGMRVDVQEDAYEKVLGRD